MNMSTIPDRLTGEPDYSPGGTGQIILFIFKAILWLALLFPLTVVFGAAYLIFRLFFLRPPIVISPTGLLYYCKQALLEQTLDKGIYLSMRIRVLLQLLLILFRSPIMGVAWYIDELIFPQYRKINIEKTLFIMTAARSGSTPLTRALEAHPQLVSPPLLKQLFPFIWLWKLAPRTVGRFFSEEKLLSHLQRSLRPDFLKRHASHPFKSDSFEAVFFRMHGVHLGMVLGPRVLRDSLRNGHSPTATPAFWEEDLIDFMDTMGKKLLLVAGSSPGSPRSLLFRGHFLSCASSIKLRFPTAHFLTVVREPLPRLQSYINFLRVAPEVCVNGAVPWSWLVDLTVNAEVAYCHHEKEWYENNPEISTVIRFDAAIADLEGTLRTIYTRALPNLNPDGYMPNRQEPHPKENYRVNRSLAELEIDVEKLQASLGEYITWSKHTEEGG